jgi:D-inositol-3-phosphate glycosyltransferase
MAFIAPAHLPKRIAVLSVHTSPLDAPGVGDAGGMNVYIIETAKRLADRNVEVDIFTRATSPDLPPTIDVQDGVKVHHIPAGPYGGLKKEELPGQLCAVTAGVMRTEASLPERSFDLIHSHYWLSGQVGWLTSERWQVPLVHSMHTMAKVKNLALAAGDSPEPQIRVIGEEQVVQAASRLIANTHREAAELIEHYDADPARVSVVHPGVNLNLFTPRDKTAARAKFGFSENDIILLFVGRIQPLKAPDVLINAAADYIAHRPELRDRIKVVICGGPSGTGLEKPNALISLAHSRGIEDLTHFISPLPAAELSVLYCAADLVAVPSHSESFGLVAIEAQACGTPVVAAAVGGLVTAVKDGQSGVLVGSHNPAQWARVIEKLIDDPAKLKTLSHNAVQHASKFSWTATADALIGVYSAALSDADVSQHPLRAQR